MNNRIFISNLVVPIIIGVPEWERAIPQNLYLDLSIDLKKSDPFTKDDLTETIDYAAVTSGIKEIANQNKQILLESFGENIINHIFKNFPAQRIELKIAKKKILPETDFVGIILTRSI